MHQSFFLSLLFPIPSKYGWNDRDGNRAKKKKTHTKLYARIRMKRKRRLHIIINMKNIFVVKQLYGGQEPWQIENNNNDYNKIANKLSLFLIRHNMILFRDGNKLRHIAGFGWTRSKENTNGAHQIILCC